MPHGVQQNKSTKSSTTKWKGKTMHHGKKYPVNITKVGKTGLLMLLFSRLDLIGKLFRYLKNLFFSERAEPVRTPQTEVKVVLNVTREDNCSPCVPLTPLETRDIRA